MILVSGETRRKQKRKEDYKVGNYRNKDCKNNKHKKSENKTERVVPRTTTRTQKTDTIRTRTKQEE